MKQFIRQDKTFRVILVLTTIILFTALPIIHILISKQYSLPLLFGDRSEAIFDLWTFQHLFSGIIIGSMLKYVGKNDHWEFLLIALILALTWEATELAMELGVFGQAVAHWKNGFEHWGNRFIGDPMSVVLGALMARRFSSVWKVILVPLLVWLAINVYMPNAMSVQHMIFGQ